MRKFYHFLFLALPLAASAQLQVGIDFSNAICAPGDCTQLTANYLSLTETTSYSVSSIPYNPPFPFNGLPVDILNGTVDDTWTPTINLPFNFSFYGVTYNQIKVGSNGVLTFDLSFPSSEIGSCPWQFSGTIPNVNFPVKNAIYGVYQDTDMRSSLLTQDMIPDEIQNVNYFILDAGEYAVPNRAFVVNYSMLPLYGTAQPGICNTGPQTSQIILHEGTNTIEVFVQNRTSCLTWNQGNGVIGIQNATGTLATAAPGRNTGTWTAMNEAWRFSPSGAAVPATVAWSSNNNTFSTDNAVTVCPNEPTSYLVTVTYQTATPFSISNEIALAPTELMLIEPTDFILCTNDAPPYTVDLSISGTEILGGVNPSDYNVFYYDNLIDAQNLTPNDIPNLSYSVVDDETIYIAVENINTGCIVIKTFDISINPIPDAPSGDATQTFIPGQTLANLVVNGQNIQWYDQSNGGNLLPSSTVLVNGTTYYASQNIGGCESRMLPGRLAVTVTSTLGTTQFTQSDIRLYPNPANHSLSINYPITIGSVEVYNLLGQLVLQQQPNKKEFTVDVSNLKTGHYTIRLQAGNESVTSKFIKK